MYNHGHSVAASSRWWWWQRVPGGGGGSEFQVVVGAEMRKGRESSERLWRGTASSLAEEQSTVRRGL